MTFAEQLKTARDLEHLMQTSWSRLILARMLWEDRGDEPRD